MTDHIPDDVSPAGRDLRAYTDELRPDHPVVRNDRGEWVLLWHDLVRRAALDDLSFSNGVSRSDPFLARRHSRRSERSSNGSPPNW